MSDAPHLFVVGASHHTTPLELREKLALGADKMAAFQQALAALPGLREFTVLNTCNRVEIYGVAGSADTEGRVQDAFCELQSLAPADFAGIRHTATGLGAVRHAITVAAGLDSQMLGETEILGQLKEAYAVAQTRRSVGPVLNRVFQKTFQHAKHVRTHTAITEGNISVANVAVELALKIFGDLASTRVLLLGAGEIGEKTAKAFQSRGARDLTVASRTLERALPVATALGAAALPWDQVDARLGDHDIVVASTSAPVAVVTARQVAAAMQRRRADPLFFIDLALPRDIEPAASELENVFLYNLDDLAQIAAENRAARAAEVGRAQEIIADKAAALWKKIAPQVPGTAPAAFPAPHTPGDLGARQA
ncbi:MAG: glutamyl-tRNA reductase [Verrucomicrobiota bacterium]